MEGGRRRRRIAREPREHLAPAAKILFGRCRPMDLRMQQPGQALEAAKLSRPDKLDQATKEKLATEIQAIAAEARSAGPRPPQRV
jgi:hypothetical protein